MCVYAGWLTHAVNTKEFISLKPWASHSRRCDVTHKRFTNIGSEMVIPPPTHPKAMLCCSSNSACCCISTYRRSSVAALHLLNFFSHITQIRNLICFLIRNGCCPWDLVCSVNWIVLLGAAVPSAHAGTSELLLVLQGCPLTPMQTLASCFPGDQSWSILIWSRWNSARSPAAETADLLL